MCVCEWLCVYLRFPLKDDHSAPFVPCCQELSSVVELDSGDDVSWGRETLRQRWGQTEREGAREGESSKERERKSTY